MTKKSEDKEVKFELVEIREDGSAKTFIYKDPDEKEAQNIIDKLLRKKVL